MVSRDIIKKSTTKTSFTNKIPKPKPKLQNKNSPEDKSKEINSVKSLNGTTKK